MEINREQIIKALENCNGYGNCSICPYERARFVDELDCTEELHADALALIKELDEENKAWQKQLITTEEKSGKAYYDLACEVEDLRNENERLKERLEREAKCQYDLCGQIVDLKAIAEQYQKQFEDAKADAVREFAERLKKCFDNTIEHLAMYAEGQVLFAIDQIAKEMLEDGYDT